MKTSSQRQAELVQRQKALGRKQIALFLDSDVVEWLYAESEKTTTLSRIDGINAVLSALKDGTPITEKQLSLVTTDSVTSDNFLWSESPVIDQYIMEWPDVTSDKQLSNAVLSPVRTQANKLNTDGTPVIDKTGRAVLKNVVQVRLADDAETALNALKERFGDKAMSITLCRAISLLIAFESVTSDNYD